MTLPIVVADILKIARQGRIDNTYKMTWGMAIVDLAEMKPDSTMMPLRDIAERVLGYYWNPHIFFDPEGKFLREGSNPSKPPELLQQVLSAIGRYKKLKAYAYKPVFYERVPQAELETVSINLGRAVRTLKKDVAHRFLSLEGKSLPVYKYESDKDLIRFAAGSCQSIADHADIIREAFSSRRTQILEDFNPTTPRISAKIKIRGNSDIRRKSLRPYRKYLDIQNPDRVCSICDDPVMDETELSIDHVIPWSFLYSDDLWNLEYAHKKCNSSKVNTAPTKRKLKYLGNRNAELQALATTLYESKQLPKPIKELIFANEHGLVEKMGMLYSH